MKERPSIKTVVLAGAGIMGASMGQIFAKYGYDVVLYDIMQGAIDKGKELIAINQRSLVEQGFCTEEESQAVLGRISFSMDKAVFSKADFVIEAIVERMDVKKTFWAEISRLVTDDVVITSNTSGLSITEMGTTVHLPHRFAGMHWVNPPHIVPLVEIISGAETKQETLDIIREVALSLHRKPVMVKGDPQGFVLNRLQFAVLRESLHIVQSGYATMEDVDAVMKYGLGMRYSCIGPFETADIGGLDTFHNIASYLFADLSSTRDVPELLATPYNNGDYGVKTGKGFYDYGNGRAAKVIEKRDKDFLNVAQCLFKDL
jgi:3-hydroxyacyl-CoA dehydrogenase